MTHYPTSSKTYESWMKQIETLILTLCIQQVRVLQGHTRVLRFKLGQNSSTAYHPTLKLKPISVIVFYKL